MLLLLKAKGLLRPEPSNLSQPINAMDRAAGAPDSKAKGAFKTLKLARRPADNIGAIKETINEPRRAKLQRTNPPLADLA